MAKCGSCGSSAAKGGSAGGSGGSKGGIGKYPRGGSSTGYSKDGNQVGRDYNSVALAASLYMGTIARYAPLAGRKQNFGSYGVRSPFENYKPPESRAPKALSPFKARPELAWPDTPYRNEMLHVRPMPDRPQPFILTSLEDLEKLRRKYRRQEENNTN